MAPVAMVVSNHAQVKLARRWRMDIFLPCRWRWMEVCLVVLWPVLLWASSSSSLMGSACVCRCRLDSVDIDAELGSVTVTRNTSWVRGQLRNLLT